MTRTSAVTGVSVSRPALIARYDKPGRFYLLATLIPWVLWLVAGYLSHRDEPASAPIAVLGLAGLLAPIAVAWALIGRDPVLVRDTLHRLVNVREVRPVFVLLAVFLLPAALLLATACSVALGYSPDQFLLRGGVRQGFDGRVGTGRYHQGGGQRRDLQTQAGLCGIAPHQIDRDRQQGVAQILTEQRDGVGAQMQRMVGGNQQIQHRDTHAKDDQHGQQHQSSPVGE